MEYSLIIGAFLIMLPIIFIATLAIKLLPGKIRLPVFIALVMLLITPSLAPATIVVIPMPFGVLFFSGISGGFINELPSLLFTFWVWHIIAFPLTGFFGYYIGKKVLSNKSNQQDARKVRAFV